MTQEESEIWGQHFERLQQLLSDGVLVIAGPTLGRVNTGIAVFEAPDEESARAIMNGDPVIAGGYAQGELRPFRVSLLRGRVDEWQTIGTLRSGRVAGAVETGPPRGQCGQTFGRDLGMTSFAYRILSRREPGQGVIEIS